MPPHREQQLLPCSACLLQRLFIAASVCVAAASMVVAAARMVVAQREIPAAGMGAESIVVHLAVVTGLGAAFVGAQAYAAALDAFVFALLVLAQPPAATLSVKKICVRMYIS